MIREFASAFRRETHAIECRLQDQVRKANAAKLRVKLIACGCTLMSEGNIHEPARFVEYPIGEIGGAIWPGGVGWRHAQTAWIATCKTQLITKE